MSLDFIVELLEEELEYQISIGNLEQAMELEKVLEFIMEIKKTTLN